MNLRDFIDAEYAKRQAPTTTEENTLTSTTEDTVQRLRIEVHEDTTAKIFATAKRLRITTTEANEVIISTGLNALVKVADQLDELDGRGVVDEAITDALREDVPVDAVTETPVMPEWDAGYSVGYQAGISLALSGEVSEHGLRAIVAHQPGQPLQVDGEDGWPAVNQPGSGVLPAGHEKQEK